MSVVQRRQTKERGKLTHTSLRLSSELHRAAEEKALSLGVTKAAYIVSVLARDLEIQGYELPPNK